MLQENQEVRPGAFRHIPVLFGSSVETSRFYRISPIEKEFEWTSMIYRAVKPTRRREYLPLSSANPEVQFARDRLNSLHEYAAAQADLLP